ncbi:hypothetical protein PsorP6_009117 [Peronosclerospora sorghi]|uniref:Uncharacterized protein n=1 Tax=Peronosclerospora sorghi TaxID=230839 RepID=A0ACC0VYK3_9STRA|nr:hypothetical protein PsorP6_009117 [Peronosclerospora sorghi]
MKVSTFAVTALASATLSSASISLPNGWFSIAPEDKIKPSKFKGEDRFLTWMADSQIKHGVEPTFAYSISSFYSGVLLAYNRTGDQKYYDYVKHAADLVLYPAWDGEILLYNKSNSIDDIRFGHTLDLYGFTGDEIYKKAAQTLRDQINRTGRNLDGGFYHRYPVYIDQMWLDGMYMLDVFYARWTREFEADNYTAWDDIALQFDLIDAGTTAENRTNGLPLHGFDWSKKAIWANPKLAPLRTSGVAPSAGTSWLLLTLWNCSPKNTPVVSA